MADQQPNEWAAYAEVVDFLRDHQLQLFFRSGGMGMYWTCNCVSDPNPHSTVKVPLGDATHKSAELVAYEYRTHLDEERRLGRGP